MMNAEHYSDPTASVAVQRVSKPVYSSTPAYVPGKYKESIRIPSDTPISKRSMEEISPALRSCIKSYGDPVACISCSSQCEYGKRAVEILEEDTRPVKSIITSNKGTMANKVRSMQEYQKAIESGDVFQYAYDHSKSRGNDPKRKKAAAFARVSFWRKTYGSIIKEDSTAASSKKVIDDEPHLKQMPCLSKKVEAEESAGADMEKVFSDKVRALTLSLEDVQNEIEKLSMDKEKIEEQISAIKTTASILGFSL